MLLQRSTWPVVEAYLERCRGILIPLGSTEQHGPSGMLGTDALCPEIIAHRLSSEDPEQVLVAPTLSVGMSQHHLAFAGSMSLRPATLMAVLDDVVTSLARSGFTHFLFLNGHGGNVATAQAAFSEIYARSSFDGESTPLSCRLRNWYDLPEVVEIRDREFGDREGSHGTPSELSLTYHAYPDDARPVPVDPPVAPAGSFTDAADLRRRYPDGRIGCDSALASGAIGEQLCAAAVRGLRQEWREFLGSAGADATAG